MASITYSLHVTGDNHIRVKVGRMREYISLEHKERDELRSCVAIALYSKGVPVNKDRLANELYDLLWRKEEQSVR